MYLHYYLNEKYVGPVDIETFFDVKNNKTLIAANTEGEDMLGGLELAYGKHIERFSAAQAYEIRSGAGLTRGKFTSLPQHVFLTKKCGSVLRWDQMSRTLCT